MPSPSPINQALAQAIRDLRAERGLSQEAAAMQCGIHRNYYGGLERAEKNPTLDMLARLARGYGIDASELLARAERHLPG